MVLFFVLHGGLSNNGVGGLSIPSSRLSARLSLFLSRDARVQNTYSIGSMYSLYRELNFSESLPKGLFFPSFN